MSLNTNERRLIAAVEIVKTGLSSGAIKVRGMSTDAKASAEDDATYLATLIQSIAKGLVEQ